MKAHKLMATTLGAVVVAGSLGCGVLRTAPEQRDEYAAWGGVAGGATGAIIGAMTGGAVAGGLFGIPLGAVAGYFIGDQYAGNQRASRTRDDDRDQEMDRLRRENERFRRESSLQGGGANQAAGMSAEQVRQVQQRLNQMGYHSGNIDGVWGPETQGALRNFQQSRNLQVTGQLNDQTARALGMENHASASQAASQQWQQAPAGQSGSQQSQQPMNQPSAQNWQQSSGQTGSQPSGPSVAQPGQQSGAQQNRSAMGGSQNVMVSPQELRQVQKKLNDMGYSAGQVDGVWGPRTQTALRNFQQSKNIPSTGRLNDQTLDALDLR